MPIGVVQSAMGGLSVEAYLRRESVEADEELVEFVGAGVEEDDGESGE